ncbi:hypothetical protein [Neisseria sp. P0014.S009]|uniref:hypothetical protein n=1 Tax=unclassified Neisseria TaxID=2623750 RepID=UPI003F7D8FD6
MANSNENTQNPKENQEKMADEGIQEHSEHTAENKQPESKDDVQNTDESTCLCKFFKKITEWMCASENKNSNKADENAAENNDAAKQEEMKQADTVEQPKEQRKLSDYLKIISKLLGIFSVYGIFIGGITIYSYLLNIGQLSIFPDVIANAANLLTISISFGIIFLIIYALLYFIFCLANPEGIKNDIPSYKLEGWSIIIVLFAIIYLILIFLNIISFSFSNFVVFCFIAFLFSLIAYLSSKVLKKIFLLHVSLLMHLSFLSLCFIAKKQKFYTLYIMLSFAQILHGIYCTTTSNKTTALKKPTALIKMTCLN